MNQTSLTNIAARGIAWNSLAGVLVKGFSFFSQLILGWILSQDDFGIFALASASSVLVLSLRNGGTEQILIQKGSQFDVYKSTVLKISLVFNIFGAVVLFLSAPKIAAMYSTPELVNLIYVIAISLLLSTPLVILRSRISVELKFTDLAKVDTLSAVIRHVSMVLFALSGYGALSFVLPLLLITLFEIFAFWWVTRSSCVIDEDERGATWEKSKSILLDSRWVILGSLFISLACHGDYMAIAFILSKAELGIYFFGFQLVISIAGFLDTSIRSVMLPSLRVLSNDTARQSTAYLKSMRILTIITAPLAVMVTILAPVLIHLLWNGKWDDAIVVVQILSLCIPAWSYITISWTLLGARGLWRIRTYYSVLDATTLIAAATLGAMFGGILYISICVSIQRLLMGLVITLYTSRLQNIKLNELSNGVGRYLIVIYFIAGFIYMLFSYFIKIDYFIFRSGFELLLFSSLMILLSFTLFNRDYRELLNLAKGAISRT